MNKAKTITKKQKLFDRPVLGPLLVALIIFVCSEAVGFILGGIIDLHTGFMSVMSEEAIMSSGVFSMFMGALLGIIMCFIYKGKSHGAFKGCFNTCLGDKKVKTIILCTLVIEILAIIPSFIANGINPISLHIVGLSLLAGVCEEAAFRVGIISQVMKNDKDGNAITRAILLSVIAFGLVHSSNAFQGQSLLYTIIQIASAGAIGFFYAAIYLRTGNAIIVMILHTFHDFLAFLVQGAVKGGIMVSGSISGTEMIIEAALTVICIVFGVILLKGKKEAIATLWKNKWSK